MFDGPSHVIFLIVWACAYEWRGGGVLLVFLVWFSDWTLGRGPDEGDPWCSLVCLKLRVIVIVLSGCRYSHC